MVVSSDHVEACLGWTTPRQECSETCPPEMSYDRSCLEARIPFRTPYAKIHCCFRCCLRFWLGNYGLVRNSRGRIDEVLLGQETTLGFAAMRLSTAELQWRRMPEVLRKESKVLRFQCPCSPEEDLAAQRAIWSRAGAIRKPNDWIDINLGDGCGGYGFGQPFGAYRKATLQGLHNVVLPSLNRSVNLVTATDCDLPSRHRRGRPFDEAQLLDHPNLKTWFTTNPNDVDGHVEKLKAIPLGVRNPAPWLRLFQKEEKERGTFVLCCCMAFLDPGDPKYQKLSPSAQRDFQNVTVALDPKLATEYKRRHGGFHGEYFTRARRSVLVSYLQDKGLCHRTDGTLDEDAYAAALADADFVVSPPGKGRACYRHFEAIIAGAVPILDYDPSPAMADLYHDMPVFRVTDWGKNVTEIHLRHFLHWARRFADVRKAFLPYWIAQLTS